MKHHPPYIIKHIFLDQEEAHLPQAINQGLYLVFWWKGYALGDLYFKPGHNLSTDEFQAKLIEAISPAMMYYCQHDPIKTEAWQSIASDYQREGLLQVLRSIFASPTEAKTQTNRPVSVVVCTRNRADQLHRCLDMLQHLTYAPEEIIVVDNAPTDNSTFDVVQQFSNVTYVKEPRAGLDIARNTGVLQASLPIVAFVDDDVKVHPLWLYQVWASFQDQRIEAMTGLVIAADLETKAQFIFEKHWSFNRGYTDIFYDESYFVNALKNGPPVWNIGAGANMAFRKSIFEEVGYFDERLDVGAAGCSGDSEMWYRILAHGHAIHYNPRAVVFHEHRRELSSLKKQIFYYMRGHAAAALIQQRQNQQAGYKRYLYLRLPLQYAHMLKSGFPSYRYRYSTIWAEISGLFSGMIYYFTNRSLGPKN